MADKLGPRLALGVVPGVMTSEHSEILKLNKEQKHLKWLSLAAAVFAALAPLLLEQLDPTSTAAMVIAFMVTLVAKFGFRARAVSAYAAGRSLVKAADKTPLP